jgi:hypothetical protein
VRIWGPVLASALAAVAAAAAGPGERLFASPVLSGELWGLEPAAAAARLGAEKPVTRAALAPTPYLASTLSRLWKVPLEGGDASPGFATTDLGGERWLLSRKGRVLGYLQKVPIDDWDYYEIAARRRFGEPGRVHFALSKDAAAKDTPEFMHMYRWKDAAAQFYILKKAPRSDTHLWREKRTGTSMSLRVLQKRGADVPLFVGVFSAKDVPAPR